METQEQILKEQGYHYLLGTAHPDNVASVNTFLKLQYEQVMTKEKYGGMKRSIFCKAISCRCNTECMNQTGIYYDCKVLVETL